MRALLATLAILATGCRDFVLVGPEANVQPRLFLQANALHDELLVYSANGFLSTGTDFEGRPQELSDSSMMVQDHLIQPRIAAADLLYQWGDTLSASDISPQWISIRTPVFSGQPELSRLIYVPLTTRADPWNVDLQMGENLRLTVSTPDIPATGLIPRSTRWQLQLRKREADRFYLSVVGDERVARELTVPWTWFEQSVAAGDTIIATLHVFGIYDQPGAPFSVDVGTSSRLVWQVRIVAPASLP